MQRLCKTCQQEKPLEDFRLDARKLYGRGYQCYECSHEWGRQYRVRAGDHIRQREKVYAHSAKGKACYRRYRQRTPVDPIKRKAMTMVRQHLTRQPCEICGEQRSHGHHDDYTQPLQVVWLCALHHVARHKRMREDQDGD